MFICLAVFFVFTQAAAASAEWRPVSTPGVQMEEKGPHTWKIVSAVQGEFTLESLREYRAKPGEAFEVSLRIRVDPDTRALPELAYYDASGREIPGPSSLATGPTQFRTDWQRVRRVFPVRPRAARVRARLRASGRGEVWIANLEFRPTNVDAYETGALISQVYPNRRRGLVLDANHGVVNRERIAREDRDGDGRWALILVDLDDLSEPDQAGEDWRTSFRYRPNEIYWFDGAVLKSDSVIANRSPDVTTALHYRARVRPGAYQAIMNDPGRAVAVSVDGKRWTRFDGGSEVELGTLDARNGVIEFWVDASYRDPISQGPAYFDYVRLYPVDEASSVDRLFQAAVQQPSELTRGSVEEEKVALRIEAPRFEGGTHWPVRCGLPIPEGELATAGQAAVLDARGNPVPSQNRTMATWPDGSVKWLYTDFSHDLSTAAEGRYTLAYGNRVKRAEPASRVELRSTGDGIDVDTGAIRFHVPRGRFGILEGVTLASGRTLQSEPVAITITEAEGKTWRALDLPVEHLEIEEVGPLHAVIRAETTLAPSGTPASGFYHRARIHVFADSPLVQVDYFVANTDSRDVGPVGGSMSSMVPVTSIAFNVKPAATIAGAVHALGHANMGAVVQKTAEVAVVQSAEAATEQRRHVPGWIALELASGGSIHAGVEAFREQFPKAFRWEPDGLEIGLWAEEGGEYAWYEGVGKTHRISLYYSDAEPAEAALLAHGPVLALAEPAWYTASEALGPLVPAAQSGLPAVERTLDANMRGPMIAEVGLGFENYGDHASPGYVKGSRLWDNNEYDPPAGAIVHFARTGDTDALRIGLAGALHYLDVDTIHYSSQHDDWAGAFHVHSHVTFGHHTAQGPGMHHAGYVQGLVWYSYLTGEPIGVLGAQGIADWVLRHITPKSNTGSMERVLGHSLMTLTDVYEATWDEKYVRGAARLVDWALAWEHPILSGLMAPITEAPGFYAGSPGVGASTAHAGLIKFNAWARLAEIDALLERLARWTLTFPWRPPAGLVSKATYRGAPANPLAMGENMRLMSHAYRLTQDPVFLAVPLRSLTEAFVTNPQPIHTRSTGRIYNFVPWFLTTLTEAGNPDLDEELEVSVVSEEVEARRGDTVTVTFRVRNHGRSPVSNLRASCSPRLDVKAEAAARAPETIPPGGEAEFRYALRTPERINLTSDSNRLAYVHWSAVYQREGRPRLAHRWLRIAITRPELGRP
ncbi:MAG: hypothetical protein GEU99_24620 [Luteitalea sp.]|nr:hypothetical protein [Luteitalea sp.]